MAKDIKNEIIKYVENFEREKKELQDKIYYLEKMLNERMSGKCVNCLRTLLERGSEKNGRIEKHSHCEICFSLICNHCNLKYCTNCKDRLDFLNSF